MKRGELLELLAFAASSALNAVDGKSSYRHESHIAHSNQLAAALGTDMRDYFEPTADRCFNHMNRSMIDTAVAEGKNKELAEGISAMKKGDAAAYAEKVLKGSGWLPAPLVSELRCYQSWPTRQRSFSSPKWLLDAVTAGRDFLQS